ncbi:MAG: site-2 protease family protein [Spirochaetaceae bacterium]|nr:site-2 protease family protein [Spirochaetaceae bacterium]
MSLDLAAALYSLPAVVMGLTVHEYSHARMAYALGDATAAREGRLTLDPLKHIDPLGFLFLAIAGFGWAKPVRFSRESLRDPRRDEALIAAAGPLSNLVIAILISVLLRLALLVFPYFQIEGGSIGRLVFNLLVYSVYVNYGLFIFNMIPIPPLDGSHLLLGALRIKPEVEAKAYRFGTFTLFAILAIETGTGADILPIGTAVRAMARAVFWVLGF